MRILIIEDEKKIASFLRKGLEEENFAVDVVYDGKDGLSYAEQAEYDCILLDVLLPSLNGISVCREIRKKGISSPILVLSALGSTDDKVTGLSSGADDYLSKPFEFEELLARIRSLIRRRSGIVKRIEKIKDFTINIDTRKVLRGAEEIDLTAKEFAILEYLVRNKNRVVTRTMIIEHVWDYHYDTGSNVVDVHINTLRNKMDKKRGGGEPVIKTVRGSGYTIEDK